MAIILHSTMQPEGLFVRD